MKKRIVVLTSLMFIGTSFAQTDAQTEVKQYWDRFYQEIYSCIQDKIKSQKHKPRIKIENTMDLRAYLRSLDYNGYVVYIKTDNITESDLCFIRYLLKEAGYFPKYLSPLEILIVNSFDRKIDAVVLKDKLTKLFLDNHLRTKNTFPTEDYPTKEEKDKDIINILSL